MRWIIAGAAALLLAGCQSARDLKKASDEAAEQMKLYLGATEEIDQQRKAEEAKNQAEWKKALEDNGFGD